MKIEFDLNMIDVGDGYWSETVASVIKETIILEVRTQTKKIIKANLKAQEQELKRAVDKLSKEDLALVLQMLHKEEEG